MSAFKNTKQLAFKKARKLSYTALIDGFGCDVCLKQSQEAKTVEAIKKMLEDKIALKNCKIAENID